jgi:hypothetical protein
MNKGEVMVATYDDAGLLVQLMRWSTEMKLEDGFSVIFAEGFDPDATDRNDLAVGRVLLFGETVGALVKHGVLNRALLLDVFWADGIWSRVGPSALRARERAGDPRLYENFESLVG